MSMKVMCLRNKSSLVTQTAKYFFNQHLASAFKIKWNTLCLWFWFLFLTQKINAYTCMEKKSCIYKTNLKEKNTSAPNDLWLFFFLYGGSSLCPTSISVTLWSFLSTLTQCPTGGYRSPLYKLGQGRVCKRRGSVIIFIIINFHLKVTPGLFVCVNLHFCPLQTCAHTPRISPQLEGRHAKQVRRKKAWKGWSKKRSRRQWKSWMCCFITHWALIYTNRLFT